VSPDPKHPDIPDFKIVGMLGEGAMARVFLALDESLDRKVALKVMNLSLANDPAFRDRFLAEARDTAKFVHPGIVSIYSTGVHEGHYYLVLEYIEAGTLKDRQRARLQFNKEIEEETELLFSAQESLVLLSQMADALAYAHSKNVIHRDIKPANIMFRSDGQAVLTDFGIAKSVSDNRELTQTGFAVGTPAYMSPEQKLGAADIDGRSDLYALGVVFYELLTGRKPHRTTSGNYADLRKQIEADVPSLPEEILYLQPLLDRLLAGNPDDRFGTAGDLANAIKQFSGTSSSFLSDATVIQQSVGPVQEQAGLSKKKKTIMAGSIAVVLAIFISVIVLTSTPGPAVVEVQPVDPQTEQLISELLDSAQSFAEDGDLIFPPSSNAAALYQRVLEEQPGNTEAVAGMERILDQVRAEIESELDNGQPDMARALTEEALIFFPNDEGLADLREQAGQ
jgi:serine/threonine-protein kinase PpkA